MTYVIVGLLAGLSNIGGAAVTWRYVARLLRERDEREDARMARLLDRIQAPAAAVARSSTDQLEPLPKPYVGFDNDEEAHEAQLRSLTRES